MLTSYEYYTQFRKEHNAFTIVIERVEKSQCKGILLTFKDSEVFNELPENLGNYYSWAAILIKKYIKEKYGITGKCLCSYYSNYGNNKQERHAHIKI
jgi:hypothetical protein